MNYAIVSEIASNITLSLYPNIVINQCRHSSILCRWYQFNLLTNEQTSERQHQSAHDNAHWTQIILVILLMNNLLQQQNIIKSTRSLCVVRWMWFEWKVPEIMLRILLVQQNRLNTAKLLVNMQILIMNGKKNIKIFRSKEHEDSHPFFNVVIDLKSNVLSPNRVYTLNYDSRACAICQNQTNLNICRKKCNQNIEFNAALELKHKIDDGGGSNCGVLSTPFMMAIIILRMAMAWGIRASYTDTF